MLTTWQEIWSQRYDVQSLGLFWTFAVVTTIDAVHELSDIGYEIGYLYKSQTLDEGMRGASTSRKVLAVLRTFLMSDGSVFLLFIELPSIVLPMLLELLRTYGMVTVVDSTPTPSQLFTLSSQWFTPSSGHRHRLQPAGRGDARRPPRALLPGGPDHRRLPAARAHAIQGDEAARQLHADHGGVPPPHTSTPPR